MLWTLVPGQLWMSVFSPLAGLTSDGSRTALSSCTWTALTNGFCVLTKIFALRRAVIKMIINLLMNFVKSFVVYTIGWYNDAFTRCLWLLGHIFRELLSFSMWTAAIAYWWTFVETIILLTSSVPWFYSAWCFCLILHWCYFQYKHMFRSTNQRHTLVSFTRLPLWVQKPSY